MYITTKNAEKQKSASSAGESDRIMNEMNKPVVITPLFSAEVSGIIQKLWQIAHMNITEGELKKKIIEAKVYKATIDFQPVGIIILTAKPLTEMTVYLSDAGSKEKWTEAIDKAASLAFLAPEVYKIKWLMAESCKEMAVAAQECGFREEGKFQDEGPNREPLISFGLSRNGNQPNASFKQNSSTEEISLIKGELEQRILFLEAKLKEAENLSKNLQKSLDETDEKRRANEKELLLLKEKMEKSGTGENQTVIGEKTVPEPNSALQQQIKKNESAETEKPSNLEDAGVETDPIEITDADIELLAQSIGITSKNTRKILASILRRPGATTKEILEETGIGINNIFTYSNQLLAKNTGLGLVVKKPKGPDNKSIKTFWPVKSVIEKMQKIAAENSGKPQMPKPMKQKPEFVEKTPPEQKPTTIPVIISRYHTEKAKQLLKANVEEGLLATNLLKELNLPCNEKTAKNLAYFIGANFAFMEGDPETDLENCKIKIQENVANAVKRGNTLIETIIKEGKQKGEEKEWQINFEVLCEKMNILGYNNPEKIKKSIKFLRNDPEIGYTIRTPYAQKGVIDNNNIIILTKL